MSEELDRHVERFNEGVRTGNFDPMLERFADDAELDFEGVRAGPFLGLDAIRMAYREQPPDDRIVVLDAHGDEDDEVATYSWVARPEVPAGEMRFVPLDGRVTRLVVSFRRADAP
jgi:SnoaL-like protein